MKVHVAVFLMSSYGAPLIGPKSFLFGTAQHSLGQMVQLIMIILSLTALTIC